MYEIFCTVYDDCLEIVRISNGVYVTVLFVHGVENWQNTQQAIDAINAM